MSGQVPHERLPPTTTDNSNDENQSSHAVFEKDTVKALGARWDAIKKLWYIVDITDFTSFMHWIPNMEAATGSADVEVTPPRAKPKNADSKVGFTCGQAQRE